MIDCLQQKDQVGLVTVIVSIGDCMGRGWLFSVDRYAVVDLVIFTDWQRRKK